MEELESIGHTRNKFLCKLRLSTKAFQPMNHKTPVDLTPRTPKEKILNCDTYFDKTYRFTTIGQSTPKL